MESFYPKKIRIHPLVVIGLAIAGIYFAVQQGIADVKTIQRTWRRL